jgi:hypothetical protein
MCTLSYIYPNCAITPGSGPSSCRAASGAIWKKTILGVFSCRQCYRSGSRIRPFLNLRIRDRESFSSISDPIALNCKIHNITLLELGMFSSWGKLWNFRHLSALSIVERSVKRNESNRIRDVILPDMQH